MIGAILESLWGPIGAVLTVVVGGIAAYIAGRNSGKTKAENERLKNDQITANKMADAIDKSHSGGGAWYDRLRNDSRD